MPDRRDIALQQYLTSDISTSQQPTSVVQQANQSEITHRFHESVGLNIQLNTERVVATRCREYSNAVLLTEGPLENNEIFEICVQEIAREWSGSLRIGVISNDTGSWLTSMNLVQGMTCIPADSWHLIGNEIRHKGHVLGWNYCPSLDWLRVGDKIGLKRTTEGNLKFYVNREDMGIAASNLPEFVYGIVELFGSTVAVCITSTKQQNNALISPNASLRLQDSLELLLDPMPASIRNDIVMENSTDTSEGKLLNETILTPTQCNVPHSLGDSEWLYEFHENHGRNVQLEKRVCARRVASYNQGIVMSSKPLLRNKPFQIKINKMNERWVSNILCGVSCISPDKVNFPVTALHLKKHSWIISSDLILHNGTKVKSCYGSNLEKLHVGSIIGLLIDDESKLHLFINGADQGVAVTDLPSYVYAVVDLYGQCEEVTILGAPFCTEVIALDNSVCDQNIATATLAVERLVAIEAEDIENSREKADLECHEKENASPPPTITEPDVPLIVAIRADENHEREEIDDIFDKPENLENSECTNVELNNATNIIIKSGSDINASHMSALSSAITSSNANNAINECIASNSQNNNNNNNNCNSSISCNNSVSCNNINNINNNNIMNSSNFLANAIMTTQILNSGGSISIASSPADDRGSGAKCEYLKACTRLKKSLVLPEEFFSHDEVLCYCTSCYKLDGDSVICKKGEPLAEYAVPVGWVRFPLRHSINASQIPQSTTDKWHVAFYGGRLDAVRWILDRGELLSKEQLDNECLTSIVNSEDQNPQVVFSPNVKGANSEEFTRQYPYIDTNTNRKLNAATAFQLLVRPGSYTTTVKPANQDSQLDGIEWATKEAGATVMVALLVHLDGF